MVARDRLAADILRGQGRRRAPLVSRMLKARRGAGVRLAVLDDLGIEILEKVGGQRDAFLAELARIGAEVPAIDIGIIVEERILVGRIYEVVLGRAQRRSS